MYKQIFTPTIMKRLAILIITIACATTSFAQSEDITVRRIEVEPSIGIGTGGVSLALEVRNNINPRWDIGPRAGMDFYGTTADVVSDYNFIRPNKNVMFFVGAGMGAGDVSEVGSVGNSDGPVETTTKFHFMPRAGVELFQHARLTVTLHTYNFSQAYIMFSLGVAIGGGRK
jgi:opacity protein-like surface antigen